MWGDHDRSLDSWRSECQDQGADALAQEKYLQTLSHCALIKLRNKREFGKCAVLVELMTHVLKFVLVKGHIIPLRPFRDIVLRSDSNEHSGIICEAPDD